MSDIPSKETLEVEFKSDKKRYPDKDLIDDVAALANTRGGHLYLGIEDNGEITGAHRDHQDPIGVAALIANNTIPTISVRAELIMESGTEILCLEVPQSQAVVSTSSGKILRRRLKLDGTPEAVPMYAYEIPARISQLGVLDFSAQPLQGASREDFDPNERQRLRKAIQTKPGGEKNLLALTDEELDLALRFVVEDANKKLVPTLTGMLMLGKEDRIAQLVPTARFSFQVLKGTDVQVNVESSKPILASLEELDTYLKAWNPEREFSQGLFRVPIAEFDTAALREGIVNAISHRDYTRLGRVRILIDNEGLSISSPGGFIDGVNLTNLLTVEPHGRNPTLSDALKRIGLAEKTGRGIDRIYEGAIQFGRPWPDYSESTESIVKLFIQRSPANLSFTRFIADEQERLGKSFSLPSLMVLSVLNTEKRANFSQLVHQTNLPETRIRVVLGQLAQAGLIETSSSGKNPYFILGEKVYKESKGKFQHDRRSAIEAVRHPGMVLKLAKTQGGVLTKEDVRSLLKISNAQAYVLIRQLVAEGKLHLLHKGKYAKYRLISTK